MWLAMILEGNGTIIDQKKSDIIGELTNWVLKHDLKEVHKVVIIRC